eukprot:scpid61574/ scgid24137/ 
MAEIEADSAPLRGDHDRVESNTSCCVACNDATESLKILHCLHAMCVACLREHVTKDGTVSCFTCLTVAGSALPGIRLEDSLVDWPRPDINQRCGTDEAHENNGGDDLGLGPQCQAQQQPVCQDPQCIEDSDSELAVSQCVDCDLYLCDGHSRVHLKKRSTRGHRLTQLAAATVTALASLGEGDGTGAPEPKCMLHPSFTVDAYCGKCEQLCFQRCREKVHCDHSPMEEIQVVADRKREIWKTQLSTLGSAWREKLGKTSDAVSTQTREIHDRVEHLSNYIAADFAEHVKNIKQREQALIDQLDSLHWSAVKQLDEQSAYVKKKEYQLDRCEHLLRNLGNSSLLAAEKTLEKQVSDVVNCTQSAKLSAHDLKVPFDVSYVPFADCARSRAADLGELVDCGCDGRSTTPSRDGTTAETPIRVHPTFDPFSCDTAHVRLSNDGHEISRVADGYGMVSTLGSYSHGVIECSIQVLEPGLGLFIGIIAEENGQAAKLRTPFIGWPCHKMTGKVHSRQCAGSFRKLGQPWRAGDILVLQMDLQQYVLTGIHQRSGCSQNIGFHMPSERFGFAVLMGANARIRMIRS